MRTVIPKARDTSWAREAIAAERDRPLDQFQYDGHDVQATGDTVYLVSACGVCRPVDAALVRTEQWRVQDVVRRGSVPDGCSDAVMASPARGRVEEFREGYWVGDGPTAQWRTEPYRSGCAGRVRDVFDDMVNQSRRNGGSGNWTIGQVFAGREYRALVHRVQSTGIKGSSAFLAMTPKRTGTRDFMDAYIRDCERLAMFHRAIGGDVAKDVKRQTPVTEGNYVIGHVKTISVTDQHLAAIKRKIITVRSLVDMVCIYEKPLQAVLERHGWRGTGKNRKTLRDSLCAALERMQGI